MTTRQARRALGIAAVALAGVIAALTLVGGRPAQEEPRDPGRATIAVARSGGEATHPAAVRDAHTDRHGHDRRADAPARRAARAVAAGFLRALLRYQALAPPSLWRADLAKTADRAIVRDLVARPPRPPRTGAAPTGRIRALEVHGPERGVIRASALIGYGDGDPSLVDLELRKRGRTWRVTRLYR